MIKGFKSYEDIKSYKNFNVALYMPAHNVIQCAESDTKEYDRLFAHIYDNVKIGRIYIENYRSGCFVPKEQVLKAKEYFESKGIYCSGGITTCDDDYRRGYASLCYSNEEHRNIVLKSIRDLAEIFDEIIFDDFYFLNCRCDKCIQEKGNRSWSEFRIAQKKKVTEDLVIKEAHSVNPDCNVIVKFPLWYEDFNETGYDLRLDSDLFDSIYTGTETRNPQFQQQHMPKYTGYFIMRYFESFKPGKNFGGWFDPYECNYNLTSYVEQGYITLFAKPKEVTLFCLGSLMDDRAFKLFAPAAGQMFEDADDYLDKLGNPVGIAAYRPTNARGENNVHNYLGECGIPLAPSCEYDTDAKTILLAEGAADDINIEEKMKKSLSAGADVIVTSGFVRKMGERFKEFANVSYSPRKAIVSKYANSMNHGLSINGMYNGKCDVLIPQMDYCINDVWELAGAYGTDTNYPLLLRWCYSKGRVGVIVIPDNMGDLYNFPVEILNAYRDIFSNAMDISLSAPAKVQLYVYDNDTAIVRSDLEYVETISLNIPADITKVTDIVTGREFEVKNGSVTFNATPAVNYVLKLER